jgi:hypothetical protein
MLRWLWPSVETTIGCRERLEDLSTCVLLIDNMSEGGFLSHCTASLEEGATVEVFLCGEGEHYLGPARIARAKGLIRWNRFTDFISSKR